MKVLTAAQMKVVDSHTIKHEPISSVGLMERAADTVVQWLIKRLPQNFPVIIFAGPGNNGGDALVVARRLLAMNYPVTSYLVSFGHQLSDDCNYQKQKLLSLSNHHLTELVEQTVLPEIAPSGWVVDGLFGTGLSRPLDERFTPLVQHINRSDATVVSIDLPSGLNADGISGNQDTIIQASYTLTFECAKPAFFFAENSQAVGKWEVLPIGLHPEAVAMINTPLHFIEQQEVAALLKERTTFAHKGMFGHALFAGGSDGKMGAVVLAAKACLHSGVGLLTVHVPKNGNVIVQTAVPEAMSQVDVDNHIITNIPVDKKINAIGIGCGMGTEEESAIALKHLLQHHQVAFVLDADAITILASRREWFGLLPQNAILTPHPIEFDRLEGVSASSQERLEKARKFAAEYRVIIVLKGAYTAVIHPDGDVWFNSTGNPGMATGGSGDVLTGIILALLAQGYKPFDAARLGVYVHGLAADIATQTIAQESLTAGGITGCLGMAFKQLHDRRK